MAFKSSSTQVVIDNEGSLVHKSFNRLTGTVASTENKITVSDAASGDFFGRSVAVGSGRIVVGVFGDDDNGSSSGSAYIFDLNGNQLSKITASDAASSDLFGYSVAVGSGRIVVGATGDGVSGIRSGSAYIFDLNGNQLAKVTGDGPSEESFGRSVAVGSGRIVVGNATEFSSAFGSAYIFDLDGNRITKIVENDAGASDTFGTSVAVGSGRICVGAYEDDDNGSYSGSAYIFDLDGNELTKITASDGAAFDRFGFSVAVGSGRIVVGAFRDGDNGSDSGSAYIFDLDGNELTKITASDGAADDRFGYSVAVGSGRICVGARNDDNGSAYIFDLDGNQLTKITASDGAADDYFGGSVAAGSGRIVVGAIGDDDGGSVYIYELDENYNTYVERLLDVKQL